MSRSAASILLTCRDECVVRDLVVRDESFSAPAVTLGIFSCMDESVDAETLRLQLQQAIEGLRQQQTLIVQAFGFFMTADALLLTYSFSQRNASGLLAASLMPLAMLTASWLILATGIPFAYNAMRLERCLLPGQITLIATTIRVLQPTTYNVLDLALGIDDPERQARAIHAAKRSGIGLFDRAMSWLLLAAFTLQVATFIIALTIFNYRFA